MVTYKFSFFFNLVEKNSFIVKKISKCRENGIDRLRNGNLPRRHHPRVNQIKVICFDLFTFHRVILANIGVLKLHSADWYIIINIWYLLDGRTEVKNDVHFMMIPYKIS